MREYKRSEFYIEKGLRYIDCITKEDLIIFEDTLRGKYYGIPKVSQEMKEIRDKFYTELSTQFYSKVYGDRKDNLKKIAHILIESLTKLKGLEWPNLPADTRPGANKSTLTDHSLLTSAIATCLIQESLHRGREIDSIVTVTPSLDKEELLTLTRIASLCHDLGKHPPEGHREKSIEAIKRIFKNILLEELIDVLTGVALRHHSSRYAREAGETPQGFFEEVICHADTASGVDRPTEILEEDYRKTFDEIIQQRNERGFPRYPVRGETIYSLLAQLKEWEEEEFKGRPISLILADVDRVKGYVFETAKLPEVRGASLILDRLNRGDLEDEKSLSYTLCKKGFNYEGEDRLLAPECILYAAGGSCLILAPAFLADQIAYEIERLYLEETGWATISVATLPIHIYELPYGLKPYQNWFDKFRINWDEVETTRGKALLDSYLTRLSEEEEDKIKDQDVALFQRFLKTKRFGELTSKLNFLLKKEKEQRNEIPIFELTPFTRRCTSCEIRPANTRETHPEEQYTCQVCSKKRDMGIKKKGEPKKGKGYFIKEFEEYLEDNKNNEACLRYLERMNELRDVEVASDLASIGNAARGRAEGYVGVIYADGNDIGRHLEEVSTPAEYRLFAQTLLNVVESSVFKSLAKHLRPEPSRNQEEEEETIHPFEIVTIGGDDLFLIVPADKALRIAYSICHHFEEEFKEGKRLTMSAGVVIAKVHSPIYFLQKLSEELLKSAKKKSRASETSTIDFLVLTSEESAATSLDQIRGKLYEVKANSVLERLKLTERPFTLSELKTLLETAKEIKGDFPQAQLYAIRQSLEKGRPFSTNFFFYQLARMKEEYQKMMEKFINKWWSGVDDKVIPYKLKNDEYVTPFVDLVEIIDFAEGEEL